MNDPLHYTETEVRSYLPTGWELGRAAEGWDSRKRLWKATLIDNVEFDWPLEVTADAASSLGRLEALRRAVDRVFRERLG
jgi:hypothetical protein